MNKSVGILGGGFGLYGYLPAFHELGFNIHTLNKYRDSSILKRPHLKELTPVIEFHETDEALSSSVDYLVFSRRPEDQACLVSTLLEIRTMEHLFLEKPLAPSVSLHKKSLSLLMSMGTPFSVGYLFLQTSWHYYLQQVVGVQKKTQLEIVWRMAGPSGWKLEFNSGGGIFDYYLIHFIPLFIDQFESSSISLIHNSNASAALEVKLWSSCAKSLLMRIHFSFSDNPYFSVHERGDAGVRRIYEGLSPFTTHEFSKSKFVSDERVPILKKYILSVLGASQSQEKSSLTKNSVAIEERVIRFRQRIADILQIQQLL